MVNHAFASSCRHNAYVHRHAALKLFDGCASDLSWYFTCSIPLLCECYLKLRDLSTEYRKIVFILN